MPNSRKIFTLLSILAGVFLTLLGLACIGFYIAAVIAALGQPDRSIVFWYLVFPMIGVPLVGTGIYFFVIGIKAYKDPAQYLTQLRYSLIVLGGVVLVVSSLAILDQVQTDRQRHAMAHQEAVRSTLKEEMHRIAGVTIDHHDTGGFTFSITVAPGLPGSYRLVTEVANSQAVFLEETQMMSLDSGEKRLIRHVPFDRLFRKCADSFRDSNVYVCIENTGAKSVFTIESQLTLLRDQKGAVDVIDARGSALDSVGKTGFSLDTFTGPHGVRVEHFQAENR